MLPYDAAMHFKPSLEHATARQERASELVSVQLTPDVLETKILAPLATATRLTPFALLAMEAQALVPAQ